MRQQGRFLKAIPNPDKLFYTYPKFYEDKKIISAVRNSSGKMSLASIDVDNGEPDYLIPFSFNVIGFPCIIK